MSKIKQQFSDLRKTTPKHVQWLLMAAAFVVVIILLTLLVSGWRKATDDLKTPDDVSRQLFVNPSETIDWSNTPVGETKETEYIITASAPVKILKITINKDIAGLDMADQCTLQQMSIDEANGCKISVTYNPEAAAAPEKVIMTIEWRGVREPDKLSEKTKIALVVGAKGELKTTPAPQPTLLPEPEPVAVPEPFIEPEPVVEPEPEPVTIKDEIRQDIETIAPAEIFTPAPAPAQDAAAAQTQSEACSDFAFPGYNASGRQIGWIKPERGAYYFHPFSDKNCDTPTGVYNPDNGIITDIKDASKKIGTDAEHIGYSAVADGALPKLAPAPNAKSAAATVADAAPAGGMATVALKTSQLDVQYQSNGTHVVNSAPYDRSFILRQYKPIPATIVSDIRADVKALAANTIPVRATVDRNVYADNGRTVIIPTGTLLMGYVTGDLPGPYTSIGRMEIKWYQFILPNGVEFNFADKSQDPFSGDAQGRVGVPGRGSTDYMEQFVMPLLTAIVPAAVNMIAPVADKFVNQIDLDNNTVVQSGTVRSSELAKNEIITAWNQVAQKLIVDMMDNTTPPFSIAAGTRITVYSPVDLQLTCGDPESNPGKKCAITQYSTAPRRDQKSDAVPNYNDGSWVGQVRSFNWSKYCEGYANGKLSDIQTQAVYDAGLDYSSVLFYCQSNQYKAINNAKQDALFQNQKQQFQQNNGTVNYDPNSLTGIQGGKEYNENVLGLKYDEDTGAIQNPFQSLPKEEAPATITCEDGTNPDANGCCTGEVYTDMGEQGFNCCPETGGDCFPPIL